MHVADVVELDVEHLPSEAIRMHAPRLVLERQHGALAAGRDADEAVRRLRRSHPSSVLDTDGAESYKAAVFDTRPLSPLPEQSPRAASREYYWHISVTRTQAGFSVHESRGATRDLLAVIVDEEEAWEYAERRATKPWRVLGERETTARIDSPRPALPGRRR